MQEAHCRSGLIVGHKIVSSSSLRYFIIIMLKNTATNLIVSHFTRTHTADKKNQEYQCHGEQITVSFVANALPQVSLLCRKLRKMDVNITHVFLKPDKTSMQRSTFSLSHFYCVYILQHYDSSFRKNDEFKLILCGRAIGKKSVVYVSECIYIIQCASRELPLHDPDKGKEHFSPCNLLPDARRCLLLNY